MAESKGGTLQSILESKAPLPPDQAIPMVIELANVLEVRHKQGKILGGIYPDQVLFEDGMVQLFELAAPRLPEDLTLMYLGFVPPEILDEQPPVVQTDIYSVGVILYSLLTGRHPFAGGSAADLIENIRLSKFEEFPKFPNYSQLEWIIKRCIIKVPSRRYASAQEVAQELRKMYKPVRARGTTVADAPVSTVKKKLHRRTREYKKLLTEHWKIAAGAGALIIAVAIFLMTRPEKQEVTRTVKKWRTERLSTTPDVERDAALSPDGRVAFVSNSTGNWELYVGNPKSRDLVQITESPGREANPRWSPDGKLILFQYEGPGVEPSLFSIPPAGGIPQKIVDDAADGQWSPDGRMVCYVTPAKGDVRSLGIYDVQALGSKTIVKDIQGLRSPSFSFNGEQIACEADSDKGHRLFRVSVKTGNMGPIGDLEGTSPSWDWKSGWIYFAAKKDGFMKIWRTDPDGFAQQVTEGEGQDFHPVPSVSGGGVLFYREDLLRDVFSISPDAAQGVQVSPQAGESSYPRSLSPGSIAFIRVQEGRARLEKSVLASKSSAVVLDPILAHSMISVSLDGDSLYVENPQENKNGLWEISLAGNEPVGLGEQMTLPYEFSPNRNMLFFGSRQNDLIRYAVRELKTQTETDVLSLPPAQRIRRAAWADRGNSIIYLQEDNILYQYTVKGAKTSKILDACYDFALRPRADQIAALTGSEPKRNSLVLIDLKTQRRRNLTSFDPEAYASTIDWSRDGKFIYYDRMKTSSELYSAD
jgi:Tol biopolymer transport system component